VTRKKFIGDFKIFIKKAVMLNEKSVRFGLEALDNEIEDLDDEYFKMGLRLTVDKTDAAIIDEILTNKIELKKNKYMRRFMTIVKRTVLAIREGLNTRLLILILFSLADLPKDDKRELEYDIMKDPPSYINDELDNDAEGEKYRFTSKRQYAMACEDIEYCGVKQGVVLNPARHEIIVTPECENRERVIKILTGKAETTVHSEDLEDSGNLNSTDD